jgi:hypothetical protein
MPKLDLFLVAGSFSIDRATNRLSLFDILSEVRPEKFLALIPKIAMVSELFFEDAELELDFQLAIKVTPPNLPTKTVHHNFTAKTRRHRIVSTLAAVPLREPGRIHFELLVNGNPTAEFQTNVMPPEEKFASLDTLLIYPEEVTERVAPSDPAGKVWTA